MRKSSMRESTTNYNQLRVALIVFTITTHLLSMVTEID